MQIVWKLWKCQSTNPVIPLNWNKKEIENEVTKLKEQITEVQDRGMRTTLIFKGITESPYEKNWDNTTSLLAETLHNLCPETPTDTFIKQIERAHRTKPNSNKGKNHPIIAKYPKKSRNV